MAKRKQRRNARLPSEMLSGGFAISTYDQDLIEENARDKFSSRYGDPEARAEFLDAGLIKNDGTPTTAGWHELTEDISRLEINALKWLRRNFQSVRDEGHGNRDELIGTFWYDPDNANQVELIEIGIEERIDMVDCSYGDLCDTAFDGVSDFGGFVLGGEIHFFDVEGIDEED